MTIDGPLALPSITVRWPYRPITRNCCANSRHGGEKTCTDSRAGLLPSSVAGLPKNALPKNALEVSVGLCCGAVRYRSPATGLASGLVSPPRKKLSSKLSNRYRKTRVWYVFGPRIVQNPRFRDRRSPWKRIQVPVGATPWGFKSPLSHRQSFHTLADTDHDPAPAGFLVCWTSPLAIIPSSSSIMRQPLPSSGSLRVGSPPSTVQ
jgi:hypothetical protein